MTESSHTGWWTSGRRRTWNGWSGMGVGGSLESSVAASTLLGLCSDRGGIASCAPVVNGAGAGNCVSAFATDRERATTIVAHTTTCCFRVPAADTADTRPKPLPLLSTMASLDAPQSHPPVPPPVEQASNSHPSPKRASSLAAIATELKGSVQRRDNQPLESVAALRRARWTALVKWFKSNNGSGSMVKALFASLDADGSGDVDIMEVNQEEEGGGGEMEVEVSG